ncbi:MAG TPA: hypothetical protein VD999_05900 [Vitreimonas sp.]|nr:hypothetical protein [Vitreimonas sp.]
MIRKTLIVLAVLGLLVLPLVLFEIWARWYNQAMLKRVESFAHQLEAYHRQTGQLPHTLQELDSTADQEIIYQRDLEEYTYFQITFDTKGLENKAKGYKYHAETGLKYFSFNYW